MTGAGARAMLNIARMMYEVGGKFFVQNLSGQPRDIFEACGLGAFVPVITAAQRAHLTAAA
jgi:anti-anti-sigma regulatory factor